MASQYGWTKDYIFYNVYPDELPIFTKYIQQRIASETYRSAIVALNPNTKNPKELLTNLKYESEDRDYIEEETLDVSQLNVLKEKLGGNNGFNAK